MDRSDTRIGESWVLWAAGAMAASLWHVLIDQHIGLNGPTSEEMSFLQAAASVLSASVFAWWLWMTARAVAGDQQALRATAWLVIVVAVFSNGVVAFVSAPPPSAAFPYQDLAHGAALVLGLVAARTMWTTVGWGEAGRLAQLTVSLLIANLAVGGTLMVANL